MALSKKYFGYYYFEKPDYDDCLEKTVLSVKGGALLGGIFGLNSALITSSIHERSFEFMWRMMFKHMWPPVSIAFLGASCTCALANLRGKKDDSYNYLFGWGIPAGMIWTRVAGCSGRGAAFGAFIGLAAVYCKKADLHDFVITNISPTEMPGREIGHSGMYGGDNWGDYRIPGVEWKDPGRKPWN